MAKDLKEILASVNLSKGWKNLSAFLMKHTHWLLFILLVFLFAYGSFLWYFYILHSSWSAERTNAYMKDKNKGVIFNRSKFNEIVSTKERRGNEYNQDLGGSEDIFKLKSN